jgi:hypothetical protein
VSVGSRFRELTPLVFAIAILASACSQRMDAGDSAAVVAYDQLTPLGEGRPRAEAVEMLARLISRANSPAEAHPGIPIDPANVSVPQIRVTFSQESRPRGSEIEEAILFVGPFEVPRPGTALLQYHVRAKEKWEARTLRGDEFLGDLTTFDSLLGLPLTTINGLTGGQFHAVRRSIHHTAAKSRAAISSIVLISVEDVIWPNSALGFPKPGMMYSQMMTPGHKVLLRLPNGADVECHTSASSVVSSLD